MIEQIENRIVERLREGLGEIVREVKSYGGELDGDDLFNTIRAMPSIWVTYAGASIEARSTSRGRYLEEHRFVTMIAVQSVRSEESARKGGVYKYEVGTYNLIKAVRYLLTNQTLDGIVYRGLRPTGIRSLFNHYIVQRNALSVFAIEWSAVVDQSQLLEDGAYPEITDDPNHEDYWFNEFRRTALIKPLEDLHEINAEIKDPTFDPGSNAKVEMKHITRDSALQNNILDMLKGKKDE